MIISRSVMPAGWVNYMIFWVLVPVLSSMMLHLFTIKTIDNEAHDDPRMRKLRPVTRKEAYAADITYGTNNEFGFDYLRDNMVK